MDGKSLVLSAPTSFGKSLVVDALIASGRYDIVVMIVPTIALVDETRRRLNRFKSTHKIVTHPDQALGEKSVLVMTQERVIERNDVTHIDLLIIDEFYKLDPPQEQDSDRASALNHALYKLRKLTRQTYLLGPNIDGVEDERREARLHLPENRFQHRGVGGASNQASTEQEGRLLEAGQRPSRAHAHLL